ncbi:unnamed protein product, partial [Polarella glacialis]
RVMAAPSTGPLIEDVTPADRRATIEVAEYELECLPAGRKVFLKKGSLFFLSSKKEAFRKLAGPPEEPACTVPTGPPQVLGLNTLE